MGSTASSLHRRPPPPARSSGRRHRLIIGSVAIVMALVAGGGGARADGIDDITVRLWLFLAILVAAVLAIANGFDRRYPTPSIGAVALRAVSLGALIALVVAVVADPFVHGPADGGSSRNAAMVGAVLVALLAAAIWYGLRNAGPAPTPAPEGDQGRVASIAVGPVAVGLVAVPTVLGHLVIAFFAAYCGGGGAGLLWLLAGLATPVTLWSAERTFDKRWPRAGLAVAVGRLVLVILLQVGVLGVITAATEGDAGCESTIGIGGEASAGTRISRAATGQ